MTGLLCLEIWSLQYAERAAQLNYTLILVGKNFEFLMQKLDHSSTQ